MLTVSVCHHLLEKLKLLFSILNQLQGVSESSVVPKQGREVVKEKEQPKPQESKRQEPKPQEPKPQVKKPTVEQHENKPKIDLNVNEASGSKGNEKLINDDDDEIE